MKTKLVLKYHNIVNDLLHKFDIDAKWSETGVPEPDGPYKTYWWSEPDDREVCIPKPKNIYRFMVCLHEIGHVVKKLRKHQYWQEYVAEKWAIETAKLYGIKSAYYEKRAAAMLVGYIKSDIATRAIRPDGIKPEVIKFIRKNKIRLTKKQLSIL